MYGLLHDYVRNWMTEVFFGLRIKAKGSMSLHYVLQHTLSTPQTHWIALINVLKEVPFFLILFCETYCAGKSHSVDAIKHNSDWISVQP